VPRERAAAAQTGAQFVDLVTRNRLKPRTKIGQVHEEKGA
jgi:hypothetical protein